MALLNTDDLLSRKPLRNALMLKDYLLDDMSSCSSSGFLSYPRRNCCTNVRFLLDIDLKNRDLNRQGTKKLLTSKSTNTSTAMAAFQRASVAVANAVKLLPFAAAEKSPSSTSKRSKTKKNSILPRLSRKLLKRSFWKRTDKEIERQKSFKYFLEQKGEPSYFSPSAESTTVTTVPDSASSKSNSWSDSDFTSDDLRCSNETLEKSCDSDAIEVEKRRLRETETAVSNNRVGVPVGDDSTATAAHSEDSWPIENEKQQFSPVSVLEKQQFSPVSVLQFPCEDEDDDVSSPFQRSLARMEGTKQELMQRIQRFENLAQLHPVDLEKRFSAIESTGESPDSSPFSIRGSVSIREEEEDDAEHKAEDLLELMKAANPPGSSKFDADNLVVLLEFFREKIAEAAHSRNKTVVVDCELINAAQDWANQVPREMFLGWEDQENRGAYVRDMEKGGEWSHKLDEHGEGVAAEVEDDVFCSMVNELCLDLFSS